MQHWEALNSPVDSNKVEDSTSHVDNRAKGWQMDVRTEACCCCGLQNLGLLKSYVAAESNLLRRSIRVVAMSDLHVDQVHPFDMLLKLLVRSHWVDDSLVGTRVEGGRHSGLQDGSTESLPDDGEGLQAAVAVHKDDRVEADCVHKIVHENAFQLETAVADMDDRLMKMHGLALVGRRTVVVVAGDDSGLDPHKTPKVPHKHEDTLETPRPAQHLHCCGVVHFFDLILISFLLAMSQSCPRWGTFGRNYLLASNSRSLLPMFQQKPF